MSIRWTPSIAWIYPLMAPYRIPILGCNFENQYWASPCTWLPCFWKIILYRPFHLKKPRPVSWRFSCFDEFQSFMFFFQAAPFNAWQYAQWGVTKKYKDSRPARIAKKDSEPIFHTLSVRWLLHSHKFTRMFCKWKFTGSFVSIYAISGSLEEGKYIKFINTF